MAGQQRGAEAITRKIAALTRLDKRTLLKLWSEIFQTKPAEKMRKELMVPLLAYRMQEVVYGGLSGSARRRLQALEANQKSENLPSSEKDPLSVQVAKLVRTWKGETHEVLITESGFVYRGERFKNLSPIAKRITGTQWSGPAFFGTRVKEHKNV